MEFYSLLHVALDLFTGCSGRNATWQIRGVGRKPRAGRLDNYQILQLLLLQTRLVEDAVECTKCQFIPRLTRDGNEARLLGMLVLTVTALSPGQPPTILLDQLMTSRTFMP